MKITLIIITIGIILIPIPGLSEGASCPAKQENESFQVKEEWKTKFPFDIVYPIGNPPDTDIDTVCPTFEFFGIQIEMCSIKQIAIIIKGIFISKIVIDSIKNN